MPPGALYQRTRELEIYLDGNPAAWFAADTYGPWLVQLRAMGVRDQVDVQARAPGPLGHVLLAAGFARHERGLDGFDPEARIDGLEFALAHPGHAPGPSTSGTSCWRPAGGSSPGWSRSRCGSSSPIPPGRQ